MAIRTYLVSVDDAAVSLAELAERLRETGFEVTQQLEAIGVIIGRVDEAEIARVRAVPGVRAVEEERIVEPWSEPQD
jgi:hypothetical protein